MGRNGHLPPCPPLSLVRPALRVRVFLLICMPLHCFIHRSVHQPRPPLLPVDIEEPVPAAVRPMDPTIHDDPMEGQQ